MKSLVPITAFVIFLFIHEHTYAQTEGNGMRLLTSFSGWEVGAGFPYLTKINEYKILNSHANLGLSVAFSIGRIYPSGITLYAEPGCFLSLVRKTTFVSEVYSVSRNAILHRTEISDQHNLVHIQLPLGMDVNAGKKIAFGGSLLFTLPIAGKARFTHFWKGLHYIYDFYQTNYKEDDYKPRDGMELGFTARILYKLSATDTRWWLVGLTYENELTSRYPGGFNHKAIMVSFVTRKIATKEKRQKWDRF